MKVPWCNGQHSGLWILQSEFKSRWNLELLLVGMLQIEVSQVVQLMQQPTLIAFSGMWNHLLFFAQQLECTNTTDNCITEIQQCLRSHFASSANSSDDLHYIMNWQYFYTITGDRESQCLWVVLQQCLPLTCVSYMLEIEELDAH